MAPATIDLFYCEECGRRTWLRVIPGTPLDQREAIDTLPYHEHGWVFYSAFFLVDEIAGKLPDDPA